MLGSLLPIAVKVQEGDARMLPWKTIARTNIAVKLINKFYS